MWKYVRGLSLVGLLAGFVVAMPTQAQEPFVQVHAFPPAPADQPGLLFYLSGDHGFTADYAAGGVPAPNFQSDVKILPGGSKGSYIQCGNTQLLSYWAPGNIYAQRGTLAFDWRSRDPVDATEFPIFRVGYADHSSWDMVWLRIDYNGHGFDAFVTDVNLGRTRVSYTMPDFPKPNEWVHLALAWDENTGIKFYVNGKLAGAKAATGMFDAALDQFGPHSRIIGPTGVESSYNFDRGGDIDELRIYDRALSAENIATLAKDDVPQNLPPKPQSFATAEVQKEWWYHYGWNRPGDIATPLASPFTTVRKVEIHDVYDLKRWWWRATDGIRETTWPGVYNRSRLTGRNDYFQLPDWDTYSVSGKSVTFFMPDERWNHLEIEGGAWGSMVLEAHSLETEKDNSTTLFERPQGQERTFHQFDTPITGQKLLFTNVEQEEPIGELSAYYVHPGKEPDGILKLSYRLTGSVAPTDNPSLDTLVNFIQGRYPADQRQTLVAMPAGGGRGRRGGPPLVSETEVAAEPEEVGTEGAGAVAGAGSKETGGAARPSSNIAAPASPGGRVRRGGGAEQGSPRGRTQTGLPIVHLLISVDLRDLRSGGGRGGGSTWQNMDGGLDGIAIDLPALRMKPTHGEYIPMNIQVKDPLWPLRDMLDFSFSVKPNEPHTLWLDTRDRILPNDKSFYLTISSASPEFGAASLEGAEIRLIFKPRAEAIPEHVADRFTQVKDNYSNMVEEAVSSERLNAYNRFYADITDLLKVDPTNDLGLKYWYDANKEEVRPPYTQPTTPAGVPAWAALQVMDLDYFKRFVNWYIDNRQIENGEFGGGLSDDSDLTDIFPGLVFMGAKPEKITGSVDREMEAMYREGLVTNGLASGQYDELHSYEDGINVLGQMMLLDFGSPKELERAMVTAKRLEWLTGINAAGHRHIRSAYFSGSKMAEGGVWGWSKPRSYYILQTALSLVRFNGTPETRKMLLELSDGLLAHRKLGPNGRYTLNATINFKTDQSPGDAAAGVAVPAGGGAPGAQGGGGAPWFMFWPEYQWTGDTKYLQPLLDQGVASLQSINSDAMDMLHLRDTLGRQIATSAAAQGDGAGQFAWQVTGDTHYLEHVYRTQLEAEADREYINTEGSLWIDRVADGGGFNTGDLQRARLGGIVLQRDRIYPGNVVGWQFDAPARDESVAILIPEATPDHFKVLAYNLDDVPVRAHMTGWEINPGTWQITQGIEMPSPNGPADEPTAERGASTREVPFERSTSIDIILPPHVTTVLDLKLVQKSTPYWSRPDLGLDPEDVKVEGRRMVVTVHSVGAVDAPASYVVLRNAEGKVLGTAPVPALKAPLDLLPKTAVVTLTLPAGAVWKGGSVTIEGSGNLPEITQLNNRVQL
jgi:hypothetical protein